MGMPEEFYREFTPEEMKEWYVTQGSGVLSPDKRIEGFYWYSEKGPSSSGPALILVDYSDIDPLVYLLQGTHRSMAALDQKLNGRAWVIDSEEKIRYLNHILDNPESRPGEWNYEREQIPISVKTYQEALKDAEDLATGYTLGDLLNEYYEQI